MKTIEREELKTGLDAGDKLTLVMAMHEHHFEAAHIPGSIQLFSVEDAERHLQYEDDIVVYCSDRSCVASKVVGDKLLAAGFKHVRHYPGGLSEWHAAGYPLEGSAAT
ncbi:MAG: rhodanese-like domain-containing protein [Chloroflexota bacterium]